MATSTLNPFIYSIAGILLGALTGAIINHRLSAKNKKEEFLFHKKADYFEKIIESLENNLKIHHNAIEKAQKSKKKEIKEILEKLKKERKNFKISTSPLYLKTNRISKRVLKFVSIEKNTFAEFSRLTELSENGEEKARAMEKLRFNFQELKKYANEIVREMKRNMN